MHVAVGTTIEFSWPSLANIIITTAAVIAAFGVIGRWGRGVLLKFLRIDTTPEDVLTEVKKITNKMHEDHEGPLAECRCAEELEQVLNNQGFMGDALATLLEVIVPPDTHQIQQALDTLRRAGILNGDAEEEENGT